MFCVVRDSGEHKTYPSFCEEVSVVGQATELPQNSLGFLVLEGFLGWGRNGILDFKTPAPAGAGR